MVERISNGRGNRPRLDRAAGRAASGALLRRHLATAPAPFLEGALENPALSKEELVRMLRNRRATASQLTRVGRQHRWTRDYDIKRGLLLHPRTPPALAARMVPHLLWRDLAEVSLNQSLRPMVRRMAEEMLSARLEDLTVGERITIARRASRHVIQGLLEFREQGVLQSLLGNSRLVEMDAIRLASADDAPAPFLAGLAKHSVWGHRRSVRLALLSNRRTPIAAGLRVIGSLHRRDLQRVAEDGNVPTIIRVGATRALERESNGAREARRG